LKEVNNKIEKEKINTLKKVLFVEPGLIKKQQLCNSLLSEKTETATSHGITLSAFL
jgi:hypothetical protein